MIPPTKKCGRCQERKAADAFNLRHRRGRTELQGRCKACVYASRKSELTTRKEQRATRREPHAVDTFTREEKNVWNQRLAELIARVRGRAA